MLAHMIGDGSCVKRQPIRYASIDEQNLAAVTIAARTSVSQPVRDEYPAARVTTLRLPAPYRLTHGKRNPIAAWLDKLGLFGKRSHEKFVPAEDFRAPNDQVALFLKHLWATDGSVRWDAKQDRGGSTTRRPVAGSIDDVSRCCSGGVFRRIKRARARPAIETAGTYNSWRGEPALPATVGVQGSKSRRKEVLGT